jgi:hypothetical protein
MRQDNGDPLKPLSVCGCVCAGGGDLMLEGHERVSGSQAKASIGHGHYRT